VNLENMLKGARKRTYIVGCHLYLMSRIGKSTDRKISAFQKVEGLRRNGQ
jgi:hypothetical protein